MTMPTPDETLLGLLAAEAQHGYQLLDAFRDPAQLGRVWNLSTSQLYAVLKRLQSGGLINGEQVNSADAPTRTEYRLTESGKACLAAWLDEPNPSASIRRIRVEFLSRLYIARLLNQPTIPIVLRQKSVCERERTQLLLQRTEAAPGMEFLTLDLQLAQLDAVLQWIERCELVPKGGDL
jgi:DNA-binding PadR family transcriptional regulator